MRTILENLVNKIKTVDGISHKSIYKNLDYEITKLIDKQVESDGYWLDINFEVEMYVGLFGSIIQELSYVNYKLWKEGEGVVLSNENSDYLYELLQNREW